MVDDRLQCPSPAAGVDELLLDLNLNGSGRKGASSCRPTEAKEHTEMIDDRERTANRKRNVQSNGKGRGLGAGSADGERQEDEVERGPAVLLSWRAGGRMY